MLKTFSHGIHPPEHKELTNSQNIKRLRFSEFYSVLLSQHAGKPARAVVRPGQEISRGQVIAEADGFMSVPMHSPVSGTVVDLGLTPNAFGDMQPAINIKAWPASSQSLEQASPFNLAELERDEIIQRIQNSGMVGLGGAAFPTHVKFKPPPEKKIETLIVNGCECEPYLTADHRVMLEMPELVLFGTVIALKATGARRAVIALEDNKSDAAEVLRQALEAQGAQATGERAYFDFYERIDIEVVRTKYPQGAEKMLVSALLNREIPSGGLPADLGLMVSNISTLAEIAALVPFGLGLIERVVTITGEGVTRPGNYIVPIGTPLEFLLGEVGVTDAPKEVIFGGPMMGMSVANLYTPVTKAVSGILVLPSGVSGAGRAGASRENHVMPCIKCAACLDACPINLNPSRLGMLAKKDRFEDMQAEYNLFDCFECGACSFVCPSNIPLVQLFRMAKKSLRKQAAMEAKS